ncbi:MAG: recombination mediator RecR [Chloroherpetonaceae bacterium]|jgi:recombination protein RecR|nr:recombination mediator RecR [bacterium]HAW07758.1 recombination protein RecR [Bacteroidota bacterium]
MTYSSPTIEKLVNILSSLPTIGKKTAQRLTYHLIKENPEFIQQFADTLVELHKNVKLCSVCFNYTETDPCPICASEKRKRNLLCVVEDPSDVIAIEKTNDYFGIYHVLHGVIDPLEGTGPEDLKIKELLSRLDGIEEVILALNPSIEGEATTLYLARLLKPFGVKISRIASGVPMGTTLEFTDEITIARALNGRIYL